MFLLEHLYGLGKLSSSLTRRGRTSLSHEMEDSATRSSGKSFTSPRGGRFFLKPEARVIDSPSHDGHNLFQQPEAQVRAYLPMRRQDIFQQPGAQVRASSSHEGAGYFSAALRIHLILTWIRILGSTFGKSGSGSSDPPFRNTGSGSSAPRLEKDKGSFQRPKYEPKSL